MALRVITVKTEGHNGLKFKEHDLTHRMLDGIHGLELGPADHNSFGLEGSLAVAPADDFDFYKDGQVIQSGKYIETDIVGEADNIPVDESSQGYVLSSHVMEHVPNFFKAIIEFVRVIREGGYIDMIIPQRDALPSDRGRELTQYEMLKRAYDEGWTPATVPAALTALAGGPRGHYWVFTSGSLIEILSRFNREYLEPLGYAIELVEQEDPDLKVGNGFCLIYKVHKQAIPEGVVRTPEAVEEIAVKQFVAELENPPEETLAAVMKRKRNNKPQ